GGRRAMEGGGRGGGAAGGQREARRGRGAGGGDRLAARHSDLVTDGPALPRAAARDLRPRDRARGGADRRRGAERADRARGESRRARGRPARRARCRRAAVGRAALARVVAGARHGVSPAGRPATGALPQAARARARIARPGARARAISGDLNAHAVDSVQGLTEIIAFQHTRARGAEFAARARDYLHARMPFLHDLTLQSALHEIVTGLGGLAVLTAGGLLAIHGQLDPVILPVMTLLAVSAFVPVWEIAQVGRQLADTLGATRRFHAIDTAAVAVQDGSGVPAARS